MRNQAVAQDLALSEREPPLDPTPAPAAILKHVLPPPGVEFRRGSVLASDMPDIVESVHT